MMVVSGVGVHCRPGCDGQSRVKRHVMWRSHDCGGVAGFMQMQDLCNLRNCANADRLTLLQTELSRLGPSGAQTWREAQTLSTDGPGRFRLRAVNRAAGVFLVAGPFTWTSHPDKASLSFVADAGGCCAAEDLVLALAPL